MNLQINTTNMLKKLHHFGLLLIPLLMQISLFGLSEKDHILVVRNNAIVFDALGTGDSWEDIQDITIINKPNFGQVDINDDFSLTFKPYQDICEETDEFSYLIYKKEKVDTVSVIVEIICENLTFLSGFSPDEDGVNDTYNIIGAENYPNNSLVVFNKWGEEVFSAIGYDNSWDGRDKNDELLVSEDNVYYYVFNDGVGNIFSGYLKIE